MKTAIEVVGLYGLFLTIQIAVDRLFGWQLFEMFSNQED